MPFDAANARRHRSFTPDPARRRDIAQEVTDEIIGLLEAGGELPWRCPWRRSGASLPLRHEGTPYRGINVFLLGLRSMARGYGSPYWLTYNQATELGGQVRKGQRATTVVYYGVGRRKTEIGVPPIGKPASDADDGAAFRFLKHYAAFNAEQIDGLPSRYHPSLEDLDAGGRHIPRLREISDAMVAGIGVDYVEGGDRACYSRSTDRIHMPEIARFSDPERFYATKFHELAHACEPAKRLGIDYGVKNFGNDAYAKGELFAEATAGILGATLGFRPDHIEDHAAYVQSWLKALRNDKRFVLKAAADAQRAVDYLVSGSANTTPA